MEPKCFLLSWSILSLKKVLPMGHWLDISPSSCPSSLGGSPWIVWPQYSFRPLLEGWVLFSPSFSYNRSSLEFWGCKRKRLLKFIQELKAFVSPGAWEGSNVSKATVTPILQARISPVSHQPSIVFSGKTLLCSNVHGHISLWLCLPEGPVLLFYPTLVF